MVESRLPFLPLSLVGAQRFLLVSAQHNMLESTRHYYAWKVCDEAKNAEPKRKTCRVPHRPSGATNEWASCIPVAGTHADPPGKAPEEWIPSRSSQGLGHFLKSRYTRGRQHAVVRLLLGILCKILQRNVLARRGTFPPRQSLLLHAENTVIPTQVVVYSPKGTNHTMQLLFGTSVYDLKQSGMPSPGDLSDKGGLKLFSPASALVKIPEPFFCQKPHRN